MVEMQAIKFLKNATRTLLDRTNCPELLWLFAMTYVAEIHNRLADESLGWQTPHAKCFGVTPNISPYLVFMFYEKVLYLDYEESFPHSREKAGSYWLGVAHNVGDALTYYVLTKNQEFVVTRSVMRPADDRRNPNNRVLFDHEAKRHDVQIPTDDELHSAMTNIQFPNLKPATIRKRAPRQQKKKKSIWNNPAPTPSTPVEDAADLLNAKIVKAVEAGNGEPPKQKVVQIVEEIGKTGEPIRVTETPNSPPQRDIPEVSLESNSEEIGKLAVPTATRRSTRIREKSQLKTKLSKQIAALILATGIPKVAARVNSMRSTEFSTISRDIQTSFVEPTNPWAETYVGENMLGLTKEDQIHLARLQAMDKENEMEEETSEWDVMEVKAHHVVTQKMRVHNANAGQIGEPLFHVKNVRHLRLKVNY